MSIQKAFQLASASAQFGGGYFHRALGSEQILGGHLISLLRREREALAVQQAPEFRSGETASLRPFTFTALKRQIARLLSARSR
jgi:hypothetical protein